LKNPIYTEIVDTIVISAPKEISLDDLRALLSRHWTLQKTRPDRIAIEESNSRVYLYHPPLESGEADLKRLFVDYSWQELVKKVVLVIGDNPEWRIDNEYGTELPGDQFVAWIRNRKTVLGARWR